MNTTLWNKKFLSISLLYKFPIFRNLVNRYKYLVNKKSRK